MKSAIDIATIVKNWLNPDNGKLQKATKKTVNTGLFSQEDIEFQLSVLRENIKNGEIEAWANRAGLSDSNNAKGKKVLCLHAGNLPLVGFQTVLGTILSGADYCGKLSRKDPHLLSSFLEEIKQADLPQEIEYSTELNHFKDLQADKVIFAGSEESVPEVKEEITRLKAAKSDAGYIIRTAKFSLAYINEWTPIIARDLTEAMLRYGGKGCRSVAMVVSTFELDEVREELGKGIKAFWKENPQHQKPSPDLKYQYAYNKAVDRPQLWLEDFLIQQTDELPETDFTVNWVRGYEEKVRELKMQFGDLVQTVYTTESEIQSLETEELKLAQRPPLWWKPDGVDVVEELV